DFSLEIRIGPRLADEVKDPRMVDSAHNAVNIRACAHDDARRVGLPLLDRREERRAVHVGHAVVGDDEVDAVLVDVAQRLDWRGERRDRRFRNRREDGRVLAQPAQRVEYVRFVVDDQQGRHPGLQLRARRTPSLSPTLQAVCHVDGPWAGFVYYNADRTICRGRRSPTMILDYD